MVRSIWRDNITWSAKLGNNFSGNKKKRVRNSYIKFYTFIKQFHIKYINSKYQYSWNPLMVTKCCITARSERTGSWKQNTVGVRAKWIRELGMSSHLTNEFYKYYLVESRHFAVYRIL